MFRDVVVLAARLVRDPRVPRPVRWMLALALLPIPGPFEELAGGAAIWWLVRRRPQLMAEYRRGLKRKAG